MENESKKKGKILSLFLSFFKIGAISFGGGYAMIALLENEFIEKKGWINKTDFLDMVAISESTPGPVAINSATYIGYKIGGVLGSAIATIAVSLPSFIVIYIISLFFDKFLSLKYVSYAFKGIQVGVIYLILSAGLKMLKTLDKDPLSYILFFSVLLLSVTFSLLSISFSSIFFILFSGLVGLVCYSVSLIKKKEKKQ